MIRVLLGLALLLLLYETIARDIVVGTVILAVTAIVLNNEPTIADQFKQIFGSSL